MDKDKERIERIKQQNNKVNKYNKHNKLESYNFLKSVKDKEKIVLDYYKKINSRIQPKPLSKSKKLTRKNLINKFKTDNNYDELDNNEKDIKKDKPKTKIAPRGEEPKKHVIMD